MKQSGMMFVVCLTAFLFIGSLTNLALGKQFEGFWAEDFNNDRLGLDYHHGEYGHLWDETQWIGKVTSDTDATPYNYWFQSGIHNTYEHDNDPEGDGLYGFLKHSSTLIELDFHPDSATDWEVYHTNQKIANCRAHLPGEPQIGENVKLSECLEAIRQFHDDFPDHHVITLWLEMKSSSIWETADSNTFNQLLLDKLGNEFIYDQDEMKRGYATLREAVNEIGWPSLGTLRGKIIIVLFTHAYPNQLLLDYETNVHNTKTAFVAPAMYYAGLSGNGAGNVGEPTAFEGEAAKNRVIFYSLEGKNYADKTYGLDIFRNNRVSSTFYVDDAMTPGVTEHRDFFVQQARWGQDINEHSLHEASHYSGRLLDESSGSILPAIGVIRSSLYPNLCLAIENSSTSNRANVIYESCETNKRSQFFALVDVAVDLTSDHFPTSRGYLLQAVIGGNTQTPNQKVIEVQGFCCNNTSSGKEVFQYSRESLIWTDRPEDQYWKTTTDFWGVRFNNMNSQLVLTAGESQAVQGDSEGISQWTIEPAPHD